MGASLYEVERMDRDYIIRRNKLNEFYKSALWKKTRLNALKRDKYLCVKCGKPAEVVHHVEHLTLDNVDKPEVALNLDNLMSLCSGCHFEAHRGEHCMGRINEENNPYTFDANGMLIPK